MGIRTHHSSKPGPRDLSKMPQNFSRMAFPHICEKLKEVVQIFYGIATPTHLLLLRSWICLWLCSWPILVHKRNTFQLRRASTALKSSFSRIIINEQHVVIIFCNPEKPCYSRPFFNIQTTGEISPAGQIPSPVVTGKIRKILQLFGPTG